MGIEPKGKLGHIAETGVPLILTSAYYQRRLHADLETPVSAYLKLRADDPFAFLFESVEGREVWARYSILGLGARRVLRAQGGELTATVNDSVTTFSGADPLEAMRKALAAEPLVAAPDAPPFVGGIFGFLAYDSVRAFEPVGEAPCSPEVPDALFVEPEVLAVFDNRSHSLTLYARCVDLLERACKRLDAPVPAAWRRPEPKDPWSKPTAIDSRADFEAAVESAKEHIRAGDIIQVVLSRRFELPLVADPFDVYRGLRTINPSPYLFYLQTPEVSLAGASPEVMIRVLGGTVTVRPIAGTRPRGETAEQDGRLAQELLADPKERAEHIMLVDLGRNDVGRVCKPGSVEVGDLMVVEMYSHVMHIVTEVRGQLAAESDIFDALRAAFPAGTLSGAPKVRAMQIIDALERRRRGVYGGAVGYFGPSGDCDFGIAIRTLEAHHDRLVVQAGAGIVADSTPSREADETEHKAQAVLRAAKWATSSGPDELCHAGAD